MDKLLQKLNEEPLLTLPSKKIIWQILRDYGEMSKSDKGIPRGIGISAYLSELYLRSLDEKINSHPDIYYYARYVDDIIAVFSPSAMKEPNDYFLIVKDEISKLGLQTSESEKTVTIDLRQQVNSNLDYLGYHFEFGTSNTKISLSNKKIKRYKKRLDLVFDIYTKRAKYNEKKARKLLVKRIRFLTGNTRLLNNKRNALVGIFFSNSLANDISSLSDLDNYLVHKISGLKNVTLQKRLSKFSFKDGYNYRRFINYSEHDLHEIVSAWKHDEES